MLLNLDMNHLDVKLTLCTLFFTWVFTGKAILFFFNIHFRIELIYIFINNMYVNYVFINLFLIIIILILHNI